MNLGTNQDWAPVVLRKKPQTAAARKDEAAVNAVRRIQGLLDAMGLRDPCVAQYFCN